MREFNIRHVVDEIGKVVVVGSSISTEVDLSFGIKGDVPKINMTDVVHLTNMLANLLVDAFKFTTRGNVHVGIDGLAQETLPDDRKLQLKVIVTDTGCGIDDTTELFLCIRSRT